MTGNTLSLDTAAPHPTPYASLGHKASCLASPWNPAEILLASKTLPCAFSESPAEDL